MTRTTLAILLGLAACAVIAPRYEGAERMGIWGGYLLGAGISLLGGVWVRHCAKFGPERVLRASLEAFLAKLGVVAVCVFTFRFVEAAAQAFDWRTFLVSFVAAAVIALFVSSLETARVLKGRRLKESLS